ncbi:MAG: hypothetical protein LBH85_08860, partial [Treponema sp.]|nr:hypothetical protein [Treponema sp.]
GYVGSDRYGLYAGSNTLEPKADAAIETALKGGVLDPPANKFRWQAIFWPKVHSVITLSWFKFFCQSQR